jgi:diacylglycerol kinase (ATP)
MGSDSRVCHTDDVGPLRQKMTILVVHNPAAGEGHPKPRTLVEAIRAHGHEVIYRSVAKLTFRKALRDDADLVLVAGGDGTVAKVARRLIGTERPMTIIPLGTANNIGRHLGFDLDPFRAIEALPTLVERSLDAGVAEGPWGRRVFFEGIGWGLISRGLPVLATHADMHIFPDRAEEVRALRATLATLLGSLAPTRSRFEMDGRVVEGDYLIVEAMNIGSIGPGVDLVPDADTSDGLLDVLFLGEAERGAIAALLARPASETRPPLPVAHARELRFEWDGSPVHIDDDIWADERHEGEKLKRPKGAVPGPARVFLAPRGLRVFAPPR